MKVILLGTMDNGVSLRVKQSPRVDDILFVSASDVVNRYGAGVLMIGYHYRIVKAYAENAYAVELVDKEAA